jgi:hypothetical protein
MASTPQFSQSLYTASSAHQSMFQWVSNFFILREQFLDGKTNRGCDLAKRLKYTRAESKYALPVDCL